MSSDRRGAIADFIYNEIKHGDKEHKAWLRSKSYELAGKLELIYGERQEVKSIEKDRRDGFGDS